MPHRIRILVDLALRRAFVPISHADRGCLAAASHALTLRAEADQPRTMRTARRDNYSSSTTTTPTPTPSFPGRVRLVGRDAELATLLSVIHDCFQRQPMVILITGEPGVGKTRLMTEISATAASELNANVLTGFAIETGGMPSCFPISRAIKGTVDELAHDVLAIATQASVLAIAGLVSGDFPGFRAPASLAPDAERVRLYDAFAEVCLHLAKLRPLLLALDDLQWADTGTWQMVAYAARAADAAPLGIVLACRDEVLAPGSAATQAVVELNRHRLLVHLPLSRLTPEALRLLGQELLGGPVTDEFAAALARRSEGNPFFAEEVLRGLRGQLVRDWSGAYYLPAREKRAADVPTPATLRLTIVRRLEGLPAETQAVLKGASVLGRSFSSRLVARMRGQDVDEVERCLAPAVIAGVIAGSAGEYAFSHDIIRETAYDLAAGERRRLHEAAARALEDDGGRSVERLGTLAHHWREADVPLAAARAASEAARAASTAAAHTEALHYSTAACELYERTIGAGAETEELLQARLALAEAALTCGDYSQAVSAFRLVLSDAQRRGERRLEGHVWARLGVLLRRREQTEESAACFRNALTILADGRDARREFAEVLIELAGLEGLTRARYREAADYGDQALAIAAELGDRRLQANAAMALAGVRVRSIDPAAGIPLLRQALDEALAAADPLQAAEACAALSNAHYWTGELQRAHEYARRRLELAERAGDVFGMRHAHSWLANVLLTFGQWENARQLLDRCEPSLARLDTPEPIAFVRILRAVIAYQLGDYEDSCAHASEAIQLFERVDPATVVWYLGVLVLACIALGRKDEAARYIRLQEIHLEAMAESALPARSARTVLGLAYVDLGDRHRAADCERSLRAYAGDHHWWLTRRTLANLAAFRGDTALALDDLASAERQARLEGLMPDLALILSRSSELLGPSTAEGQTKLREARQLLAALGMRAALARADGLLGAAIVLLPAGLTPREIEVLRHLAHGRTNREIAELLVISEHTVINHLSHIFAKIGVDNRTGAAAFAHRQGIV
jgi:predicted ATPase/DNA-binding CsgD family transcriptional regulator